MLEQLQLLANRWFFAGEVEEVVGARWFNKGHEQREPDVVIPASYARFALSAVIQVDVYDGGVSKRK